MHLYRLMTFSVSTVFRHDELLCGRYVSRTLDPYLILSRRDVWHYEIATIIGEDSTCGPAIQKIDLSASNRFV